MDLKCQAYTCKDKPEWRVIVTQLETFQIYYLCSSHMDNRVYPKEEELTTFTLVAMKLKSQLVRIVWRCTTSWRRR